MKDEVVNLVIYHCNSEVNTVWAFDDYENAEAFFIKKVNTEFEKNFVSVEEAQDYLCSEEFMDEYEWTYSLIDSVVQ